MDAYLELFKTDEKYERIRVAGGQTDGFLEPNTDNDSDPEPMETHNARSEVFGQQYALEYQLQEEKSLLKSIQEEQYAKFLGDSGGLNELDDVTVGTSTRDEFVHERSNTVYQNYNFNHQPQSHLPIYKYNKRIVTAVEMSPCVVIEGHTGCGKTTQVPQYLLDNAREKGEYCNIVVTQPRRIAAISIAHRVARERNWLIGSLVGYKVGLCEQLSQDTRLLYCTTGVLLQTIINSKSMSRYTHIVLDEVHERDQEMDFLMMLVRRFRRSFTCNVKLILMSATINTERFSEYFTCNINGEPTIAPVIHVTGKMRHQVQTFYLEDLNKLNIPLEINSEEPSVLREHHLISQALIRVFDSIEQSESPLNEQGELMRGSVLVFVPGILYIEDLYTLLSTDKERLRWVILPLHSSITREEQSAAFMQPPTGFRKIIIATNIAESSITVPDAKYVIDYCMTKELVADNLTTFTTLKLLWASKANCLQRAGRTGRVCTGRVYRLVSRKQFDDFMEEQTPEIRRCPLERPVLMSKIISDGPPKALLALTLDPPDMSNIERTIILLKEIGGLTMTANGKPSVDDGDITFLGRLMSRLPLDIHISKMIALGHMFGVLEDCIVMGACMSVKSIFSTPFRQRLQAYESKLAWSACSASDPIAYLIAFKAWKDRCDLGYFKSKRESCEMSWTQRYFLQLRSLREINDLVGDIKGRLSDFGLGETNIPLQEVWDLTEEPLVLKLVLAGAFYPNYFVRGSMGGQISEKDAIRQLVGRSPFNTVYLQGMPQGHPGDIYAKSVKELLKDLDTEMRVSFDDTKKVYVEFPKEEILAPKEGQPALRGSKHVSLAVYKAVKLRQLQPPNSPLKLPILPLQQALERSEQIQKSPLVILSDTNSERLRQAYLKHDLRERWKTDSPRPGVSFGPQMPLPSKTPNKSTQVHSTVLPGLNEKILHLKYCHVDEPGRFWVTRFNSEPKMQRIFAEINRNKDDLIPLASKPRLGQLVLAPYQSPGDTKSYMFRARVIKISQSDASHPEIRVFFIDYGNREWVEMKQLRDFGPKLKHMELHTEPGYALECTLAHVQPSLIKGCGQWSAEATEYFRTLIEGGSFFGRIYSVVNSVISFYLYSYHQPGDDDDDDGMANSINHELVKKQFAQSARESYLSQKNHEMRKLAMQNLLTVDQLIVLEDEQHSDLELQLDSDPTPPRENETTRTVALKGPYSPLEMKIYQIIRGGGQREIGIDQQSVNSVLIDDDPQDTFDRMIVAASVTTSQDGIRLTLRQTTILPSLPGMPALVCLLFSPQVELRTNKDYDCITGGLFGLGHNGRKPYFPEHDIELAFDTRFSNDDIRYVNQLRLWMNMALQAHAENFCMNPNSEEILLCQRKVKKFLQALLSRKREIIVPQQTCKAFKWGQTPLTSALHPEVTLSGQAIYPMHWSIALKPPGEALRERLIENSVELHNICAREDEVTEAKCEMCQVRVQDLYQLKEHLQSAEHIHNECNLNSEAMLQFDQNYDNDNAVVGGDDM